MRTTIIVCVWVLLGAWVSSSEALPVLGQVVDSKARPVEGAEVAVYEWYAIGGSAYDAKLVAPIVKTDATGRFQLQANVSNQYGTFIVARKQGLALAWDGLNYSHNTKGKGLFPLVLEPPCALTGQVVDSKGSPIVGAQVQALPVNSYLDRLRQRSILAPKEWFTTTTDAQGQFRFAAFAADVSMSYRVKLPGQDTIQVLRLHEQASCGFEVWRSDIRLQLPVLGAIEGRVVDEQGQPVSGVDLMISPNRSEADVTRSYLARKTTSDRNGAFAFAGIPEGEGQIEVLAPEEGPGLWVGKLMEVSVKAGPAATEATIHVVKGGVLEVTVLSAQARRPVPGARVSLYARDWWRDKPARTDAKGIARVRAPAGEYDVYVTADQFVGYQSKEQVAAGQTVRYEALLSLPPTAYGRVLGPGGEPVRDAVVSVHPFGDHAYSDSNGRFEAACDEQHAANGGFAVARDVGVGSAVAMRVTDWSRPIDLRLAPAWTLTGKVVGPDGAGIPAARVSLCLSTQNCLSQLGVELLTDAQGRFEMKAIPPVQDGFMYRLSVAAAGYGPREYLRISPSGAPGTVVDVGETELPLADQSVSGVVVDPNGVPAAHVPIFVNGLPRVSQPSKATATNERGEFALTRLCRGPIRIQANFGSSPGGAGFIKAELPARNLKIILGQQLVHEPEVTLAGKPLPDLKELGLSSAETDGKPVLVCFFDMQQRPSRQALLQLAGQADTLTQKGIVVAAVQASVVAQAELDKWVRDSNVPFRIGMVGANAQETRLTWGIMSLPWLILADRSHLVRAEGFALGELENQLATTGESP
ncbi:MAG: carboxypeptidase regulatory-like domain-containing protein [Sedimentisphaerales bacterium]|nr:carboxypeptidase regulatory-like domain-containing protein [Sedimentisphaerales bacterium]